MGLVELGVFTALGVLVFSWGFEYRLFDLVVGVVIFIVLVALYFYMEEEKKRRASLAIKRKAVPSQVLAEPRPVAKSNKNFMSVPAMKFEARSRVAPGSRPIPFQIE